MNMNEIKDEREVALSNRQNHAGRIVTTWCPCAMLYLWLQSARRHFLPSALSPSQRSRCTCIRPAAPWTRRPAAAWPPPGSSGPMRWSVWVCGSQTLQMHRPSWQSWTWCWHAPSGGSKTQPELKNTTIHYSQLGTTICDMGHNLKVPYYTSFSDPFLFISWTQVEQPCIINSPRKILIFSGRQSVYHDVL